MQKGRMSVYISGVSTHCGTDPIIVLNQISMFCLIEMLDKHTVKKSEKSYLTR